jgi:hypothetical protein
MSEPSENSGQDMVTAFQTFTLVVWAAELEVHREILCLLTARAFPTPDGAINEAEIQRRVDDRINTKLAEMADFYPNQASFFCKFLEARKKQRPN